MLEQACLGEYYNIFAEQEVWKVYETHCVRYIMQLSSVNTCFYFQLDLDSFLTLSESDLIDLCITNGNDRQRLLSLIQRLQNRNQTELEQNGASCHGSAPAPLFLFQ